MRETIVSLIKPFADMCCRLLNAVPVNAAIAIFAGVLALLALWVITLKQEKKIEGRTGNLPIWRDLRTWAVLIIITQIMLLVLQLLPLEPVKADEETNDLAQDMKVLEGDAGGMLFDYLVKEADKQFGERRLRLDRALRRPQDFEKYQQYMRDGYHTLLGDFPEKTPLDAEVTGTVQCEGYRIENVVYQSRPGFYVTGNLYLPEGTDQSPAPAVLMVCGHTKNGKADRDYQKVCILLASNDIVAFIIDPTCQAERRFRSSMRDSQAYCQLDIGAMILGLDIVNYKTWDNVRAIDYLLTRPEVDKEKLGLTGQSGGGAQCSFFMAYEDRIGPAAPSCFIMGRQHLFHLGYVGHGKTQMPTSGPQDLYAAGRYGFEHTDYILLRAPKPTLILATRKDFFDIEGTRKVYEEAKSVYKMLGIEDNVVLFESPNIHSYDKPQREKMVEFMRKHLLGDNRPITKPQLAVQEDKALQVTKSGHVKDEWDNAMDVLDLNLKIAKGLEPDRKKFWADSNHSERIDKVKKLLAFDDDRLDYRIRRAGGFHRDGYRIDKLMLMRSGDMPIPTLLFVPDNIQKNAPATIYLHDKGKHIEAGRNAAIAGQVKAGRIVLAIDVRGFGETTDTFRDPLDPSWSMNADDHSGTIAVALGRPLLGQRLEEVIIALDMLTTWLDVDKSDVRVEAVGRLETVALHAAAIDDRITDLKTPDAIKSWLDIMKTPEKRNQLCHLVPSCLRYYDLEDLRSIVTSRKQGKGRK